MTLNELIAQLQDLAVEYGDHEVRLAYQPNWPFEYTLGRVAAVNVHQGDIDHAREFVRSRDGEDEEVIEARSEIERMENDPEARVVYIGEGSHIGYLPSAAAQQLGWR